MAPAGVFLRGLAATHDIVKVVVAGHQVVLGRHLRRVSQPLGNHVGRIFLNLVRRTRSPEVLREPRP